MNGAAMLAGGLAGVGLWLVLTGLRPTRPRDAHRRLPTLDPARAVVAAALGGAALLITRGFRPLRFDDRLEP